MFQTEERTEQRTEVPTAGVCCVSRRTYKSTHKVMRSTSGWSCHASHPWRFLKAQLQDLDFLIGSETSLKVWIDTYPVQIIVIEKELMWKMNLTEEK